MTDPTLFDNDTADNFLLFGAQEVGLRDEKGVHVNAIGIHQTIPSSRLLTVTGILEATLAAVRAQGGVPVINHPNYRWAFTAAEMLPLRGPFLLEIASGLAVSNHAGDGDIPSTEGMWDQLLSAGTRVFAVAVDDSHHFRQDFTIDRSNPGRGWIVARAPSLTRADILAALTGGDFYASTGVTLRNVVSTSSSLEVEMQARGLGQSGGTQYRFRVFFIGQGAGRSLFQAKIPRDRFVGEEGYVRARVEDSGGRRAWTQPVFVTRRR